MASLSCWRPLSIRYCAAASTCMAAALRCPAYRMFSSKNSTASISLSTRHAKLPENRLSSPFFCFVRGLKDRSRGVKSSIRKRFRVKSSGAIVRLQCGKRHLNLTKPRKRVNALGGFAPIAGPGHQHKYVRLLRVSPLR